MRVKPATWGIFALAVTSAAFSVLRVQSLRNVDVGESSPAAVTTSSSGIRPGRIIGHAWQHWTDADSITPINSGLRLYWPGTEPFQVGEWIEAEGADGRNWTPRNGGASYWLVFDDGFRQRVTRSLWLKTPAKNRGER